MKQRKTSVLHVLLVVTAILGIIPTILGTLFIGGAILILRKKTTNI